MSWIEERNERNEEQCPMKCSVALSLQQSTSIGHCSSFRSFRSSIHDMKTPTAHAVALSVFFTTMGFLLASTSASETATKCCGWQTLRALCFGMSSKSESLSKSFRGCFNGLGNFDIVHKETPNQDSEGRRTTRLVLARTVNRIYHGSVLVLAGSANRISWYILYEPWICGVFQRIYGPRPRRRKFAVRY